MPDDILINIYNSLIDDEISKLIINLINESNIQDDEDFEKILEKCINAIKAGR